MREKKKKKKMNCAIKTNKNVTIRCVNQILENRGVKKVIL